MTGIASSIADYIILHNIKAAIIALGFLLAFVLGATTTSLIANYVRTKYSSSEYAPVLVLEGILLLVFSCLEYGQLEEANLLQVISVSLLCFVMGLQNAAITKISKSRIRTTHITGLVTDVGIGVGRYIYSYASSKAPSSETSYDIGLHLFLVISFIVGGIIGALLYKGLGLLFTAPLAIILLVLAINTIHHKASR